MGHLTIVADDGSSPYLSLPTEAEWAEGQRNGHRSHAAAIAAQIAQRVGEVPLAETARGRPGAVGPAGPRGARPQSSPEIMPPGPLATTSGEIQARPRSQHDDASAHSPAVEVPHSTDDITQPGVHTPVPGAMKVGALGSGQRRPAATPTEDMRGSILGVGMSSIGHQVISGEIGPKVPPGARVLVPGPNGLMQSATVRQLLQGYYELEVGSSGETIWVPIGGVVPEN
jgi:hypothetical protein